MLFIIIIIIKKETLLFLLCVSGQGRWTETRDILVEIHVLVEGGTILEIIPPVEGDGFVRLRDFMVPERREIEGIAGIDDALFFSVSRVGQQQ